MLKQVNRNSAEMLERSGMIRKADLLGTHFSGVALPIKRLLAHTQVVENLARKNGNSLKRIQLSANAFTAPTMSAKITLNAVLTHNFAGKSIGRPVY